LAEIKQFHDVGGLSGKCPKCNAALSMGRVPRPTEYVLHTIILFSNLLNLLPLLLCTDTSTAGSYGAIRSQVLALAEVTETDGKFICSSLSTNFCAVPTTTPPNMRLFPKLKPRNYKAPKASGKRAKVLYLSDFCRIPAT